MQRSLKSVFSYLQSFHISSNTIRVFNRPKNPGKISSLTKLHVASCKYTAESYTKSILCNGLERVSSGLNRAKKL